MYVSLTLLALSLFTVAHPKVLDEDMLLYWRRIIHRCSPKSTGRGYVTILEKNWSPPFVQDDIASRLDSQKGDSSKCKPFTSYFISCNKCVCSADGTAFCTRMACFKKPRFTISDETKDISPIDKVDDPDSSEDPIH